MLYAEQAVTGTTYRRARLITVSNPRDSMPTITFVEEEVTLLSDGREMCRDVDQLVKEYAPLEGIALLDEATMQPTGETVPQALFAMILFALYISEAQQRDAAQQP